MKLLRAASNGCEDATAQALWFAIHKKHWDLVPHIQPTAAACKMKKRNSNGNEIVALEFAMENEAEDHIITFLIKPLETQKGIDTELYADGRTCKMLLRASKLKRLRQLA